MDKGKLAVQEKEDLKESFSLLSTQATTLATTMAPYLTVTNENISLCEDPSVFLEQMQFYRLKSCTTEQEENIALFLRQKMEKLFIAVHPLQTVVAYGITSYNGKTELVLGVEKDKAGTVLKPLLEGLLAGIEITPHEIGFNNSVQNYKHSGAISGVPVTELNDEKQAFDISTLMRSLNGQNYTLLCLAKPLSLDVVQQKYGDVVSARDNCFSVSKQSLSVQDGVSKTNTTGITKNRSHTLSAVVYSFNTSKSSSETLADAISQNTSISHDVQNGFAMEMMEYCDKAIERLRKGQNVGMWDSAFVFSADNLYTIKIIQACLNAELAKDVTDILPPKSFEVDGQFAIPEMNGTNNLFAPVTSSELGFLCTPPFESVPDFELKTGKMFPLVATDVDGVVIGNVSDGHRQMEHMNFSLSEEDLNKHTFICGITGSGKTTTVKSILRHCNKPFMVIESAKKEYRNLILPDDRGKVNVYTLGRPDIHCLQLNPFYVQCGINLQTHIDFLKDLFNASFSFYGPMPYILEKCLQNVYRNKGWNLTLGYHPFMVKENATKIFDYQSMSEQYKYKAHTFIFPTMEDLKSEVKRYVEEEMNYDGEVAGNIKTAILARLESMCVGSKGFMFNTNAGVDMKGLMEKNVVLELEGLSDDADKAFCVGLLVIFIKEYRQVQKEKVDGGNSSGLKHLLVIEEAHRLLKNVDTDRASENMGNPKGKAVEHFTNMLAEMRSYGQGVIVAEQIPSKLAPDVIKNSSNKIIQRIVSADDQNLVANTVGLNSEDALCMGTLRTGYALCHKEGMSLPVMVKVKPVADRSMSDDEMFIEEGNKVFDNINYFIIRELVRDVLGQNSVRLLNTILAQDSQAVSKARENCIETLKKFIETNKTAFIMKREDEKLYSRLLLEGVVALLVNGAYKLNTLMSDKLYNGLEKVLVNGLTDELAAVQELLKKPGYMQDPRNRCIYIVSELIKMYYSKNLDIGKSVRNYFLVPDEKLFDEIETKIKEGVA